MDRRAKHLGLVLAISFLLILAVELAQQWTKTGFFDVDVLYSICWVLCADIGFRGYPSSKRSCGSSPIHSASVYPCRALNEEGT